MEPVLLVVGYAVGIVVQVALGLALLRAARGTLIGFLAFCSQARSRREDPATAPHVARLRPPPRRASGRRAA